MILTCCLNAAVDTTYTVSALVPGETHRVRHVSARAGGKGVNVARVLHQLDEPVLLSGMIGGTTGAAIAKDVRRSGLCADWTPIAAASRRTVAVVAGDETSIFNEPGGPVTAAEWQRYQHDFTAACREPTAVVVLSGSLPAGVPDTAYAQLTQLAQHTGCLVVVDADGDALRATLPRNPDVVKPNALEAASALGRPVATVDDAATASQMFLNWGAHAAVVSLGALGLVAARESETLLIQLPDPVAGNPTGAGDALAAAIALGLRQGRSWPDTVREGAAIAAAAVAVPYAGAFDAALLTQLHPLVKVETL